MPRPARADRAEASASVTLLVRGCPALFEEELRDILGIELGELLLDSSEPPRAELNVLEVACERARARVRAEASNPDRVVERALLLDEFPGDAAPRAVALAGVEALSAVNPTLSERLRARPRAVPAEPPSAVDAAATPASPTRAPRSRVTLTRGLHLRLGALHRRFLVAQGAAAWGGRVELSWHARGPWQIGFDVEAAVAKQSVTGGRLSAAMASSGAWLGIGTNTSGWSAAVAAGARAGLAQLRGEPGAAGVRGHEVLRPWAGPVVLAQASASVGRIEVAARSEGGVALLSVEGLAQDVASLRLAGGWPALSLNWGIVF
ncbi:MAG TPA: hypothetical protein VHP33_25180 [Polyangiaceae bacterium]|nr:hypothetical protein [Polyangiaceae bacterium]